MTQRTPPLDYLIILILKLCVACFCVGLLFAAVALVIIMVLAGIGLSMG